MRATPTSRGAERAIDRWRRSPVAFAQDVLGIDPWDDEPGRSSQRAILSAWPKHKRVAARSGHKVGKSLSGSTLALWAYACHPGARVILTAPTWRQVDEVIWREVRMRFLAARRRGIDIGGQLFDRPDKGLRGSQDRQIIGFSTDDPDRFSGISGPWVFYIVDEGAGVEDGIHEAIEGNMAGGAWFITFGNPTRTEGWFFDAFHTASAVYDTHWISSERTPNARGIANLPGLATAEWIEGRRKVWTPCETSPLYQVRVAGNFPQQGATSVVSLAAITAAFSRWTDAVPLRCEAHPVEAGLDCARFGDDRNALVRRRGDYVFPIDRWGGQDSIQVAGTARKLLLETLTPLERARGKKPKVKVDVIGIGAGVYDQLATFRDLEVVAVNVAESPTSDDEERFENLRAQVWFAMSDAIGRAMLPPDPELRADCLAPQYAFSKLGKTKVESKDDIKKRLGRSPDAGDALCLAFYDAPEWDPSPLNIPDLYG